MKCLVGYITKTGTTEEIAQKIGKILGDKGIQVDVAAIGTINDLSGYDRLVLGSPVNGMKVLPEFKTFLSSKVAGSGILPPSRFSRENSPDSFQPSPGSFSARPAIFPSVCANGAR